MIEDIRDVLEDGGEARFDVVVVGAGPAGLSVALALHGSGLKVAVLEAGGRTHPGAEAQALYEAEVTGLPYPIDASRQRFFGGTSNHWGGWCRPLDRTDFQAREWIPMSGWPIGPDELDRWYAKAHRILEIDSSNYDPEGRVSAEHLLPVGADSGFRNQGFRFSPPTRFAQRYAGQLERDSATTVLLHASVTGLNHDKGRVGSVTVSAPNGQEFTVHAGQVVLATGGLEVPRLLLHTQNGPGPALGNDSGLLGRCFMEHFGYAPGYLMTRADLRYYRHPTEDGALMPVLAPQPELMERLQLNNVCMLLDAVQPDTSWPPEAMATPGLARGLSEPGWRYRVTLINEPSPNPESRVELSGERDALGLRKLRLHWAIADRDLESIERVVSELGRWLGRSGLGRLQFTRPISPETTQSFSGNLHHMGTTRMSRNPGQGVVDTDCRVFGSRNLYVASSSVFPTCGYANPTLTIVALALRLADFLRGGAS